MMNLAGIIDTQKRLNKLSHLYMFVGPKGSIRESILKSVLEILLEDTFNTLEDIYSDVRCIHITAEQTIIKKDQVLALQEEFSKTSLTKGYRVFVIEDIDQLNPSSSNSLLKFLEEPSSQTSIGILCTDKPQAILETITSRAQTFYIPKQDIDELRLHLKSVHIEDKTIEYVLTYTQDVNQIETLRIQPYFNETIELFEKTIHHMAQHQFYPSLIVDSHVLSVDLMYFELYVVWMYRACLDMLGHKEMRTFHHLNALYDDITTHLTHTMLMTLLETIQEAQLESRYFVSLDLIRRKLMHQISDYV